MATHLMTRICKWGSTLFLLLIFIACQSGADTPETPDDTLLAEVYNQKLYASTIEGILPENSSEEDRKMRTRVYVENWVKDQLLLHEAEKNMSDKLDIDKLVRDYRASLLIHHYEKQWVESRIDTSINISELLSYYDKNRDQYQLQKTIVRCYFIKLPEAEADMDDIRDLWNSEDESDFVRLVEYCNAHADLFMLDEEKWYEVDEITQLIPAGTLSERSMQAGREYAFSDSDFAYFIRILESVQEEDTAPFTYIQEQAERYIMHQRKLTLQEQLRNELYEKELSSRKVKIYVE